MNEVEKIQVYEVVSVHGMLLFGENKPEVVPTKPYLQKLEGYIVDESGSTPITVNESWIAIFFTFRMSGSDNFKDKNIYPQRPKRKLKR